MINDNYKKVITICGPTASGKSDLAVQLAGKIDADIVSADSMQIYKDMNIGTAKVSREVQAEVKHYMIDIVKPTENYSVANYVNEATKIIKNLHDKQRRVILCGGTGQYINALLDGLIFIDVPVDRALREQLAREIDTDNAAMWHQKLAELDSKAAEKINVNDIKRIRRFFEVFYSTDLTQTEINIKSREKGPDFEFLNFYIKPERALLYQNINRRTEQMFAQGLIEEVESLLQKYPGVDQCQSFQAIGYKETLAFINNKVGFEEALEMIAKTTRNYAKRQYTWFNARTDLIELDDIISSQAAIDKALEKISRFL